MTDISTLGHSQCSKNNNDKILSFSWRQILWTIERNRCRSNRIEHREKKTNLISFIDKDKNVIKCYIKKWLLYQILYIYITVVLNQYFTNIDPLVQQ